MVASNNSFSKTICSICYEDLKPIVEDLQSISICGHVFHELCLQQWFEYCSGSKKQTCPVCKQGCSAKNVGRLYFQSVGDAVLSQSPIAVNAGECPEALRREVKRLETMVSGLTSVLDQHKKEVHQLSDELQLCKEQLSKEVTLKKEVQRQKECIQSMLQTKSNDLVKTTLDCSTLQEKNLALAKELATLKLVSDCNLEEDEIVKLAKFGSEANSEDALDVLKKSLIIRNKSYKELMAKCNILGRGEARSQRKLEKAKEKIIKLKARVRELETAIEEKNNEVLRFMKASNKRQRTEEHITSVTKSTNPPFAFDCLVVEEKSQCPPSVIRLDEDEKETNMTAPQKEGKVFECLTDDEDEVRICRTKCTNSKVHSSKDEFEQTIASSRQTDSDAEEVNICKPNDQFRLSGLVGSGINMSSNCSSEKQASGLLLKDIRKVQSSLQTKAPSSLPLQHDVEAGDRCFAGGLLGPDGGNMYLGKWCKRVKNKVRGPEELGCGTGNGAESLIAVGADGRGGRIKVLRSADHMSKGIKESSVSIKRLKPEAKSSSLQSRGCLQIEHFFGKPQN